jgi:hypothetical protein
MSNRYAPGTEPICPICNVTPLRNKGSQICHPCWAQQQREDAERRRAEKATAPGTREPLTSYDEARALWERSIGLSVNRYKGPAKPRKDDGAQRILVLSDVHAPFHDKAVLADCIAENRGKVDLCVVSGDLSDCYSVSRFIKYESVGFSQEWAEVQIVLEALSEAFPRVRVVIGNHDARLEKQLLERCSADIVEAVRWMTGGTLCPMSMLCKRYENVEVVPHVTPEGHRLDWLTTIGDAIMLHAEKYSRVPASALRGIDEWL